MEDDLHPRRVRRGEHALAVLLVLRHALARPSRRRRNGLHVSEVAVLSGRPERKVVVALEQLEREGRVRRDGELWELTA